MIQHLWAFLNNSSNSSAVSAIAAGVQALAAIFSLGLVALLTSQSNTLSEGQNRLIESQNNILIAQKEREEELARTRSKIVASVVAYRLSLILVGFKAIVETGDFRPFGRVEISKGLPDTVILEGLTGDIVPKIYDAWEFITMVHTRVHAKDFGLNVQSETRKTVAGQMDDLVKLQVELFELAGITNSNK